MGSKTAVLRYTSRIGLVTQAPGPLGPLLTSPNLYIGKHFPLPCVPEVWALEYGATPGAF